MRSAVPALLCLLCVTLLACSGDDAAPATTSSATAAPQLQATAVATATPLPPGVCRNNGLLVPCPRVETPSRAWLVDVRDGSAIQIYESPDDAIRYAGFDGDQAVIGEYSAAEFELKNVIRYNLDGSEAGREQWVGVPDDATASYYRWRQTWLPGDPTCNTVEGGMELDGRFYAGADCGPMSPDGRWMLYRVDAGEIETFGSLVPAWDEWLIDLETGQKSPLQNGLAQCNADGIIEPTWSPSGRYVFLADCAEEGRVFLGDTATLTARVIVRDVPSITQQPNWSPRVDALVYRGDDGNTILEDLSAGSRTELSEIPWPARFDTTGRYLYSPAWSALQNPGKETRIYDVIRQEVVAVLPGEAAYQHLFLDFVVVSGDGDSFIAALEGAPDCPGTAIYVDASPVTCVPQAVAPSFSPDGKYVALAQTTRVEGDNAVYAVVVVEIGTGRQQVVVEDVRSNIPYPIPVAWNADSTHILVRSPYEYGPYAP